MCSISASGDFLACYLSINNRKRKKLQSSESVIGEINTFLLKGSCNFPEYVSKIPKLDGMFLGFLFCLFFPTPAYDDL